MKSMFRIFTVGTAVLFSAVMVQAQNNGQYNDPNYNPNNPQYNNPQNNDRNRPDYNDRDRNQDYNNNQNRPYNNQQSGYGNGRMIVSSGTQIQVRTDQAIDTHNNDNRNNDNRNNNGNYGAAPGQRFPATVSEDVRGTNGNVLIPRGSPAELRVVSTGDNDNNLTLDLASVTVNGHRYLVDTQDTSASGSSSHGGLGANKRTGEYVGGGALAGTLLGAIFGGGKGAAIGALAGGAAGAGTQVLTRGHSLNVPAETKLNFRIDRDLTMREYNNSYNGNNRDNRDYQPR